MKRYCQTLSLKNDPQLIEAYVREHAHVWPEVQAGIKEVEFWICRYISTRINFYDCRYRRRFRLGARHEPIGNATAAS